MHELIIDESRSTADIVIAGRGIRCCATTLRFAEGTSVNIRGSAEAITIFRLKDGRLTLHRMTLATGKRFGLKITDQLVPEITFLGEL